MKKIFLRQSSHKKKRLSPKWRRPKGLQSKRRLNHAGHRKNISSGYGNAASLRGKLNGKNAVVVTNLKDLEKIAKDDLVIVSSTLGQRKRLELIEQCKKSNLEIHNISDGEKYIETVKKQMADKKEQRQKFKKEKQEKHTEKKETKKSAKEDSKKTQESEETDSSKENKDSTKESESKQ